MCNSRAVSFWFETKQQLWKEKAELRCSAVEQIVLFLKQSLMAVHCRAHDS